ncbi:type VI secretion system contractile sheath large subunit [Ameyamaea chiangmaiensis]|uniref:Type VI secretion system contractile sheath large subunit n=1 Tax=Ameyamaea chiangmaiensis TaxID=442969 RepID=A0A850PFB7_9PROT|nr:type VI secretion system contractile sheath large subunit [Ameyamaea chiangmaiensis]MBS4076092.1 type VI secretion system contractile sheath large subunit [Ameyamaea chiangmaiensis]NVN40602.1 type VI secretion system contractile sheath large subunit [Ameyamaea chiangmaiensis]
MPDTVTAPDPAATDNVSSGPARALRDGLLTGHHTAPGWDVEPFEDFLREDNGALAAWFGDGFARAIAADPSRHHPKGRARERLRARLDRDIATIDVMIARQIDAILHHPRFLSLEGSWRGLAWLVADLDPGGEIAVKVLSTGWSELARDLLRVLEFDQSAFFRLVYEDEFGHAGGHPFGLMLIDREVAHVPPRRGAFDAPSVDDVDVVRQLAAVAAAAFVPTVLAASPRLFGVETFDTLSLVQDITGVQDDPEHRRWHDLAASEDSRFLCLTLPRLRARARWTRDNNRLRHEEYATRTSQLCWHSAGYAFARNVTRAQREFRWPADVRGVTPASATGSFVTGTIDDALRFGTHTRISRAPTELGFTDQQSQALVESGVMLLDTLPFGGVAFASTRSLQAHPAAPRQVNVADRNRRLSAEIVSLLCVSRFAHYIKMLGRDIIGRVATPAEIERGLQEWLGQYTNASTLSSGESRARYPLLSSRVQVIAREGRPGQFSCIIHLQPHYQLDDISTTFRLVTNLSSPDRAGSQGHVTPLYSGDR